jgi:hypothetical protein
LFIRFLGLRGGAIPGIRSSVSRHRRDDFVISTAGSCMRPWVWPGGAILVRRCTVADLRAGDIAVWFDGRRLLSHRVVAVDGTRFVTKGDATTAPDLPAEESQLLGRVTRFRMLGVSWPLDGRLGRLAGRLILAAPWLTPGVTGLYAPARRAVGRALERLYTARPVRRLRRRLGGD